VTSSHDVRRCFSGRLSAENSGNQKLRKSGPSPKGPRHSGGNNTVQSQLAEQQITFPPASAFAHPKAGTEITPSMIPSVSQYAGQRLLTGQQAEAYADHFIAVHIQNMAGGKTYSQLSTEPKAAAEVLPSAGPKAPAKAA